MLDHITVSTPLQRMSIRPRRRHRAHIPSRREHHVVGGAVEVVEGAVAPGVEHHLRDRGLHVTQGVELIHQCLPNHNPGHKTCPGDDPDQIGSAQRAADGDDVDGGGLVAQGVLQVDRQPPAGADPHNQNRLPGVVQAEVAKISEDV